MVLGPTIMTSVNIITNAIRTYSSSYMQIYTRNENWPQNLRVTKRRRFKLELFRMERIKIRDNVKVI